MMSENLCLDCAYKNKSILRVYCLRDTERTFNATRKHHTNGARKCLIGHDAERTQGVVLRHSLLGAYIAEYIQLLLVLSTHTLFLSGFFVETRLFSGTPVHSGGPSCGHLSKAVVRIKSSSLQLCFKS